ncbi:MAG: hypothetical protein JSR59_17020 [Proteobacteria bacterium]|nr:hypothetical protein [Pseudomonadota bacterium]
MWKWQDGAWVRTVLHVPDPKMSPIYAGLPKAVTDDGRMIVGLSNSRQPGDSGYGFVWTAATDMIIADAYLESLGYGVDGSVRDVYALTPNGQTMVTHAGCGGLGQCLLRRVPSELDASKQ